MRPPIFVYEPRDLVVFESVEDAQRYVEAIDVKNDEYDFFDADGRKLRASVYQDSRGIELVAIREGNDETFCKDELRKIITQTLSQLSYKTELLKQLTLDELVGECLKIRWR